MIKMKWILFQNHLPMKNKKLYNLSEKLNKLYKNWLFKCKTSKSNVKRLTTLLKKSLKDFTTNYAKSPTKRTSMYNFVDRLVLDFGLKIVISIFYWFLRISLSLRKTPIIFKQFLISFRSFSKRKKASKSPTVSKIKR